MGPPEPECRVDSDCSTLLSCSRKRCIDPCPGPCGSYTKCSVINHKPRCSCLLSCVGDPFIGCTCQRGKVDGAWSDWGEWGSCDSVTGRKKRRRKCDNPPPSNGGEDCSGSSYDEELCAVNGGWCEWYNWGPCDSVTGKKKRTRGCNNPPPQNGGVYCSGSSTNEEYCTVD